MNRGFTPRAVAAYEGLLRDLTTHMLDRAFAQGEFDFVDDVAAVLPIRVLCGSWACRRGQHGADRAGATP